MVVVAVLTLLSGLLISVMSRLKRIAQVKEDGYHLTCLANQKQILRALQLYQQDNSGTFPLRDPMTLSMPVWIDSLQPYGKSPQIFLCPSERDLQLFKDHGSLMMGRVGTLPAKRPFNASTYIANENLLWKWAKKKHVPVAASDVARPASTVFLSDGVKQALPREPYWTGDRGGASLASGAAGLEYILRDPGGSRGDGSYSEPFAPNPRHNGRAVVGFVDGHVQSLDLSKWYFPDTPYLDPTRGG